MSEQGVKLLSDLIAERSITGNELSAAQTLFAFLQARSISSELDVFESTRANVYAWHITDPLKPLLILCSHLDVVAPGANEGWQSDPWTPAQRGRLYYGRGVCDAKGQLAAMTEAFVQLAANPGFHGNVCLAAVAGEEKGGIGAKRFAPILASRWIKSPAYCIIGEPTQGVPCIEHMGRIEISIRVFGEEGHAARPQKGKNAAVNGARLLVELLPRIETLSARTDVGGKASIALTRIVAGTENTNTIPGVCDLVFGRRWVYTEDPTAICSQFEKDLRAASEALCIKAELGTRIGISAAHTDPASPVVQAALQACSTKDKPAKAGVFGAVCDMNAFRAVGIPTLILGFGDLLENHAHGFNEFMDMQEWQKMSDIYIQTAFGLF